MLGKLLKLSKLSSLPLLGPADRLSAAVPTCPNECVDDPQPPDCPQPTPPVGSNCCLKVRYTWDGVTWTLDVVNTACVDNSLCAEEEFSCTEDEFTYEKQDGCICFALPASLPQQTCMPELCVPALPPFIWVGGGP